MGDWRCRSIFCRRPCSWREWFLGDRDAGPSYQREQSNSDCAEHFHRVLTSHFFELFETWLQMRTSIDHLPHAERFPLAVPSSPNVGGLYAGLLCSELRDDG